MKVILDEFNHFEELHESMVKHENDLGISLLRYMTYINRIFIYVFQVSCHLNRSIIHKKIIKCYSTL